MQNVSISYYMCINNKEVNKKILRMILFFTGFFLWYYHIFLKSVWYSFNFDYDKMAKYSVYCFIGIIAMDFFQMRFSEILWWGIFFGICYKSAVDCGTDWYNSVFSIALMVVAARNIDFVDICDALYKVTLISIICVIISYYLGITYHEPFDPEGRIRYQIGFNHYSVAPFKFLGVVFPGIYAQHYKRKNGASWMFIILCFIISTYIYIMTDTRWTHLISLLYLMMYVIVYKLNLQFLKCIPKIVYISSMSVATVILVMLSKFYDSSSKIWNFIDKKLTNTRVANVQVAIKEYGISFWGRNIIYRTSNNEKGYFYIDSGYMQLLFQFGLVCLIAFAFVYAIIIKFAIEKKDWVLLLWIVCVILFNMLNEMLFAVDRATCILVAGYALKYITFDKYKCVRKREYGYI